MTEVALSFGSWAWQIWLLEGRQSQKGKILPFATMEESGSFNMLKLFSGLCSGDVILA